MANMYGRHGFTDEQFRAAFDARIDKSGPGGCWLWTARIDTKGYGVISRHGRTLRAHRVSFERFVGPITDGLNVLHRCDVRPCVNPEHLFLGTIADNQRDMAAKGRAVNPQALKTHCAQGHPLVFNGRQRICQPCRSERQRRRRRMESVA